MGLRNQRAICPQCGGKIHTQPKGLGHVTWANSGPLAQTGSECQHCGVPLTGKVTLTGYAVVDETRPNPREPHARAASAPESRDEYLARINSTTLGQPKNKRKATLDPMTGEPV